MNPDFVDVTEPTGDPVVDEAYRIRQPGFMLLSEPTSSLAAMTEDKPGRYPTGVSHT